jgi:hypothetical protein
MKTPICAKCQIELRVKTNGLLLVDMTVAGPQAAHAADLHACPSCDYEVITGIAENAEIRSLKHICPYILAVIKAVNRRVIPCWLNAREKGLFMSHYKSLEACCEATIARGQDIDDNAVLKGNR